MWQNLIDRIKNLPSTVLGVSAFLVTWASVLHDWAMQVKGTEVGPLQWLGLILAIEGVLRKKAS